MLRTQPTLLFAQGGTRSYRYLLHNLSIIEFEIYIGFHRRTNLQDTDTELKILHRPVCTSESNDNDNYIISVLNTIRVSWKLENTESSRNLWQGAPTQHCVHPMDSAELRMFFQKPSLSLGSPRVTVAQYLALERPDPRLARRHQRRHLGLKYR